MYTRIFADSLPPAIERLAATPEMRRLERVGMHCGCEYADFPIYRNALGDYSRFTHSYGVASIVWRFTGDLKQAVAGLLHDVATPVFAHVIDFLNGDHRAQESTEARTRGIIAGSREIMALLGEYDIDVDEAADYHRYPIADNDAPMLSADRLEYTLGNGYLVYGKPLSELADIYGDIRVLSNERGEKELGFQTLEKAARFTEIAMRNARWFASDDDRFAMQFLADLIRFALREGVLSREDLWTSEPLVIARLADDERTAPRWRQFRRIRKVFCAGTKPVDTYSVRIATKKRYINPLVCLGDAPTRILDLDAALREDAREFLNRDFEGWLFTKDGEC